MPTSRPRHLLAESDSVHTALEVARRRWPEDAGRPTALLLHLVEEGRRRVEDADGSARRRRLAAIAGLGVGLGGVYPPGHLAELREDWPE